MILGQTAVIADHQFYIGIVLTLVVFVLFAASTMGGGFFGDSDDGNWFDGDSGWD